MQVPAPGHPCRGCTLSTYTCLQSYPTYLLRLCLWAHNSQFHPGVPGYMWMLCAKIPSCVHVCDCLSNKVPGAGAPQEGSDSSLRYFSCVRKIRLPFQEAFPRKINQPSSWGRAGGGLSEEERKRSERRERSQSKAAK
jgi:hypothetical protein